jgi:hypothetical protein
MFLFLSMIFGMLSLMVVICEVYSLLQAFKPFDRQHYGPFIACTLCTNYNTMILAFDVNSWREILPVYCRSVLVVCTENTHSNT